MFADGIIGHPRPKELLRKALAHDRIASAYLFCGPEGVGKLLLARAFLKTCCCDHRNGCGKCGNCRKLEHGGHPDLVFLDGGEGPIKIEEVRLIQKHLRFHPFEAPRKVCLINNAEAMTTAAQSAFLKTLEEPRDNTLFILVSAQPDALLPTIRSRCQTLNFGPLPRRELVRQLMEQRGLDEQEARILAAVANGSMSKALDLNGEFFRDGRRQCLEEVAALPSPEENVLPHFQLSRRWTDQKENRQARLETLQFFFRDLLLLLSGRPESDLINADLIDLLRSRAQRETVDSALPKLAALRETERALEANANFQLTVDLLLMQLSETASSR